MHFPKIRYPININIPINNKAVLLIFCILRKIRQIFTSLSIACITKICYISVCHKKIDNKIRNESLKDVFFHHTECQTLLHSLLKVLLRAC